MFVNAVPSAVSALVCAVVASVMGVLTAEILVPSKPSVCHTAATPSKRASNSLVAVVYAEFFAVMAVLYALTASTVTWGKSVSYACFAAVHCSSYVVLKPSHWFFNLVPSASFFTTIF